MGSLAGALGAPQAPSAGQSLAPAQSGGQLSENFNVATQRGSQTFQNTPFGGLSYDVVSYGPNGVPVYSANTSLSPEQQALLNERTYAQLIGGSQAPNLLAGAGYGQAPPWEAIGSMTSGLTGQQLAMETAFLDPFFKMQREQMDTQLQNQGFTPGTTAYNNAMMPMLTGQNLDVSNFLAQAFPSQENFAQSMYAMPYNLASGLMGISAPTMPGSQFVSGPTLGPVDFSGLYRTAAGAGTEEWKAKQAQFTDMVNALGSIGGDIFGMLPI